MFTNLDWNPNSTVSLNVIKYLKLKNVLTIDGFTTLLSYNMC